jgi:glycolate oxidase iron-sulfur subunit
MDTSNVQPGNGSTSGIQHVQQKEPVGVAVEHTPAVSMRPEQLAGFDQHHPPDPELIADCVHCGFCLSTCPTYLLWGEEMDSPRGRIQLMKMTSEGEIGINTTFTAYKRSFSDRLFRSFLFSLFPHPARLRAMLPLLWLYQKIGATRLLHSQALSRLIPARLLGMEAVIPPVSLGALLSRPATFTRAQGTRRRRVGLLLGCVQRVFFDPVNAATMRVLTAEGCDVVVPPGQGCCGALCIHSGREEEGLKYARRLIDAFETWGVDTVVVNAAGCGSTMKEYAHLLRDDSRYAERARAFSDSVRDISEILAELEPVAPRHPIQLRVAYHDACHLAHAQRVRLQPRKVLRSIPGIEVVDIPEADICCGSAGIYNLIEPQPANQLGERKAQHILSTHPDVIAMANPGCLLQINAALQRLGERIPMLHPVELVDASIRGVMPPGLAKE